MYVYKLVFLRILSNGFLKLRQLVAIGSGAVYAKLMSALSLISQKKMLGRIEAEWDLTEPFLAALTTCQANITQLVSEADKREKVSYMCAYIHTYIFCELSYLRAAAATVS